MSSDINVVSRTQKIIVDPVSSSVAIMNAGPPGPPGGLQGPPGAPGAPGKDGVGVPAGGVVNQVLAKNSSTDHDTSWKDAHVVGKHYYYRWQKNPASIAASAYCDAGVGPVNPYFTTTADGSNTTLVLTVDCHIDINFTVYPGTAQVGSTFLYGNTPGGRYDIGGNSQGNQIGGGIMVSGPHSISGSFYSGTKFVWGTRNGGTAGSQYLTSTVTIIPIGDVV